MAPPGVGLILATVALRYHYMVDVLASFALAPPAVWVGMRLHRLTERWKEVGRF
jgi:membrane-associated phospholipid phosphatase